MQTHISLFLFAISLSACSQTAGGHPTEAVLVASAAPEVAAVSGDPGDKPVDLASCDDRRTTLAVRNAVMADESLSNHALNMNVVTSRGVITLRGPMKSKAEIKNLVAEVASVTGNSHINDELYVEGR